MPGAPWTEAELDTVASHPELTGYALAALLPGRSPYSVGNIRKRSRYPDAPHGTPVPEPAVKAPGDYLETLADLLADDFELLGIWVKWNGYASVRELSRDALGWVTLICTAKGEISA